LGDALTADNSQPNPLALLLVASLLIAGWIAAQRGIADAAGYFLQESLEAWRTAKDAEAKEPKGLREAEGLFASAIARAPGNPELLQQGGRVYEWRSIVGTDPVASQQDIQAAIGAYRRSLQVRPAWPYTWLDLATAKARANEFDDEFQNAFAAAQRFGPWEEQIQRDGLALGLASWGSLSAANRRQLRSLVERLIGLDEKRLLMETERAGRLPLLCIIAEGIESVDRQCEQRGI